MISVKFIFKNYKCFKIYYYKLPKILKLIFCFDDPTSLRQYTN